MKTPTTRLWPIVGSIILLLQACQKEISSNNSGLNNEEQVVRAGGAVPDDPALVAKVPMIVSSEFYGANGSISGRGVSKRDKDGDGIPDTRDGCPIQKETVNGYQDTDGCPDTVPAPTITDSDGDGISDTNDACPSQKETVNGYKDADGCPDTVPDTDGDGIIDTEDLCPAEAETLNGYQDTDGCPDTPPVIIPPTTLPTSAQLIMPPIGNQGAEFSCVAFAAGYAARSAEQFYKTGASGYNSATNIFSPEFLYNQTKFGDCGAGTSITTVLEFLKANGICTGQSMPYSDLNGCSLLPTSSQLTEASNYKINSYSVISKADVTAIKTTIVNRHPLILTVNLDASFTNAPPGFVWKAYSGADGFGHALVICGYDDARHAFKVMNSWGTNWGDAGYSWIDYDFLAQTGGMWTFVING